MPKSNLCPVSLYTQTKTPQKANNTTTHKNNSLKQQSIHLYITPPLTIKQPTIPNRLTELQQTQQQVSSPCLNLHTTMYKTMPTPLSTTSDVHSHNPSVSTALPKRKQVSITKFLSRQPQPQPLANSLPTAERSASNPAVSSTPQTTSLHHLLHYLSP
jgi:hypothetical protein